MSIKEQENNKDYDKVVAIEISNKYIKYYCEDCSEYEPTYHKHGNSFGDMNNRVETRGRHCLNSNRDIHIVINENTWRVV